MAIAKKIKSASETGRLGNDKELGYLLSAWQQWGADTEARSWLLQFLDSAQGLAKFLSNVKSYTRSGHGSVLRVTYYYRLPDIEQFLPIDEVTKRIEALDVNALSDEAKADIKLLKQAIKRKEQGRSDFDIGWDGEADQ